MLDLLLLGGADLRDARGADIPSVHRQPKRLALLAYLAAARPRGFHRRDSLLALFWPELDEAAARNALGQAVHFLRRELGDGVLVSRGRGELGVAPGALRCDAAEMEREIAEGRPERALELYRGDFLAGIHPAGAAELGHWLEAERARLRTLAADTARTLADARLSAGDAAEACRWMRFAARLDPLDERGARRLMEMLDTAGDRPAAMQAYDDFARRLRDELQAEPGPAIRALADALRRPRSEAPPIPAASPAPSVTAAADREQAAVPEGSIAVLPFLDLSPEPQPYLADGLTEELITALALVDGLRVTSRTSSFAVRGRPEPLRVIAGELGVATVLEGSVRCAGGRVRVVAQLIDAATDTHLWTEAYDRPLHDVLGIQSQVAEQIARALRVELSPAARGRIGARPAGSGPAFDLYLQGRWYWSQGSPETWPRAVECFRQAIEADPRCALAYCGLADAYLNFSPFLYRPPVPRSDALEKGRLAALRALELDDELGEAHSALAVARWYGWDWEGSERAFRRAILLNPGLVIAHQRYALCLAFQARFDEARREIRRAQELDPLSLLVAVDRAVVELRARRFALAIAQLERVLQASPGYAPAEHYLSEALVYSGRIDLILKVLEREGRMPPELRARLMEMLRTEGPHAFARAFSRGAAAAPGAPPTVQAASWSRAGEMERAWACIEQAIDERDPVLADAARIHTGLDPLRLDPRWNDVLRRMGIGDPPPVPEPACLPYPAGWETRLEVT